MKTNSKQKDIIEFIRSQLSFFESTNDITSPTHLVDIEESVNADLMHFTDQEQDEIANKVADLYWFIRKYDK